MSKRVPFTPTDLVDHQRALTTRSQRPPHDQCFDWRRWRQHVRFFRGGNDVFTGGYIATAVAFGDAFGSLFDFARGGDDTFAAALFYGSNTFYGDAGGNMSDLQQRRQRQLPRWE